VEAKKMNTPENLYQEEITEDFKKIDKCILCGSSHIKNIYESRDRHYGIKGEFTIDQCEDCKLVFLNPMPTEEYLTSLYPKEYYAYQEFHNKSSALKAFYRNVLVKIKTKDPKFAKPGRILDVGCGSGLFLYKMKQEGWEVYGVEVNESAAKLGNEAEQLNIHVGDLVSTNYQPDFFDYVRSNHSFEHIGNPHEVLNEIHRILKPDGKLFIGVPNFDSFNSRLFKKYWWYLCPPVHTFNYSVSNLKKMLENHGFEVEKAQFNGDYAGILGSFQIYMNRHIDSNTTSKGAFMNNKLLAILAHRLAKLLNLFKTSDVMEIIAHKKGDAGK
jgi:SAM-dependent methyltransferase